MPTKKQIKKSPRKLASKPRTVQKKTHSLCTWLFKKPLMFSLLSFSVIFGVLFLYSIIAAIFNITSTTPLIWLLIIAFCWTIYYMIKKLPHDDMYRDDFIAITNGCSLITVLISVLMLFSVGYDVRILQYKIMWLYAYHPVMLWFIGVLSALLSLYVIGVTISNIYAKYKRATQIGISKRMVIATMPFTFLLAWTPGYLIEDNKHNSNLQIKSKWYARFNKWVVKNSMNTLFTFLMFVLLNSVFSSPMSLLLTGLLLVIYALWNLRYKTKFMKDINQNYALVAVGINIAILIVFILRVMIR